MIDSKIKAYADMLLSNSCKLLIDKPTRIIFSSATLIDHIISNNVSSETISEIGLCDISDHLAVFAIIPASCKCNKPNKRIIRDLKNFNQDHFLNDLCQQFNKNLTQTIMIRTLISLTFVIFSRRQMINIPLGDLLRNENNSRSVNPGSLMDF